MATLLAHSRVKEAQDRVVQMVMEQMKTTIALVTSEAQQSGETESEGQADDEEGQQTGEEEYEEEQGGKGFPRQKPIRGISKAAAAAAGVIEQDDPSKGGQTSSAAKMTAASVEEGLDQDLKCSPMGSGPGVSSSVSDGLC